MLASHARVGATLKREFPSVPGLHLVGVAQGISVKRALHGYRHDPSVLYAEPNYVVRPFALPNDPMFSQQWGLSNTGQNGGTAGADIHAPQAWDITTGSSSVVVAVIDSGIDYTHPDLAANIWSSPVTYSVNVTGAAVTCSPGTHGFNAVASSCDPIDDYGHGTQVAGIIGAAGNNGVGMSGVNWDVEMAACKFMDSMGFATTAGAVACLDYVKALKDQGVNIVAVNASWGSDYDSQALIDAIAALQQDGILFIAAAGDNFSDNDVSPVYPANIFLPNLLSVAATSRMDAAADFTNIGAHTVHLGAPGQEILTTLPGASYELESGTSMSAPFVTGVAALLAAANPASDWRAIRNLLLAGGDALPTLANTVTGKRLNAYGALTCSNSTVGSRLQPIAPNTSGAVGSPLTLAYLSINCGQPSGPVSVQSPSEGAITLLDDGVGADLAAGDGIFSGQYTPLALGSYALTFPGGDIVNLQVLANYYPAAVRPSDYNYRIISGTDLNLGDDSVGTITSPFPVQFGEGSFSTLYVSSNGTISLTDAFGQFNESGLLYAPVATLVAPFWQDLYPIQVSGNGDATDNNVFWEVTGIAPNRELVVEWRDVESYECRGDAATTVKFQVVFKEGSSDVLFNYANTEFGGECTDQDYGGEAGVGIQVAPTVATMWGSEQAVLGNGSGILWKTSSGTQPSNPVPVISSVSPSTVQAGGPDFVVTITGSNFVPQSLALNAPYYRPTTFVSSTEMQVLIPAADIQYNGAVGIEVYNPSPGGGFSNMLNVTVSGESAPVITGLNPSSAVAGGFGFRMEIDGTGFSAGGTTVQWNGTTIQSLPFGTNRLVAEITSDLIANQGTAQITVNNLTNGGVSKAVAFTITAPTSQSSTSVGSSALASSPGSNPLRPGGHGAVKPPKFLPRFMGWTRAQKEGPEYLHHFLRLHAGTTTGAAKQNQKNAITGPHPKSFDQSLSLAALPGFDFRPTLPADLLPTSVATGDFNRDGHMDWVVANGGANSLWIYLGNGDGTAQLPMIIPLTGQSPVSVAAADLRGIGILDLIVAEADSGTIGVLLGNGDGTFGVETSYYLPAPPLCLLVDDFNGDGHKDILVGMNGSNTVGEIALLPGDGAGHFGAPIFRAYEHPAGLWTDFAALNLVEADLNGDGFPDLIVLDVNDAGDIYDASALLNQKDGTFKTSQTVDWAMPTLENILTNVAVGDVNGDGCTDLIDTDGLGAAKVFLGNCDGTFQTQSTVLQYGLGDVAGGLALADVNGDGKLDIVTSSVVEFNTEQYGVQPGNLVSVLLGDGKGSFSPARVFRGGPSMYSLALADLNGDGKLDIITANQDADSVSVFLNDGSGGFGEPGGGYLGYPPPPASSGVIDAPIGGVQGGIYGEPYYGLKVADVNGDGKPDLVALESGRLYPEPVNLAVLLNQGSGVFSAPIFSPVMDGSNPNPGFIGGWAMGDFRGTGRPDFVAVGSPYLSGTSSIAFAKNNGDGTFTPLPLAQPAGAQGMIGVGDFNGDGKLDFVVVGFSIPGSYANGDKSTLQVFLGNGDGTFTPGYATTFADIPGDFYPAGVWVGDFNGDGKPDVLVQLTSTLEGVQGHDVYEFLSNGDGTFAAGKDVLQNMGTMNVADLNHDGIGDVVAFVEPLSTVAAAIPLQYAVYLGQHDGSFVLQNTYDLNTGKLVIEYTYDPGVMLADFNGDGNIDIAAFQAITDSASYWGADTLLQILAGNGDGTFTPTATTFDFNQVVVPQFAADLNGDGKADLLEMDNYGSAYQVIPAVAGPALQVTIPNVPIVGSTGYVQLTLPLPSTSSTTVQLTASDPAINIPASVVIAASNTSWDVPFQIGSGFNSNHVFSIQATLEGQTVTAYGWQAGSSQPAGFRLILLQPSQTVLASQTSADYEGEVFSIDGYTTNVQLSCTGLPNWASCQFAIPTVYVPAGSYNMAPLQVTTTSAAPVGAYPFTLIATDGTVTEQANAVLYVGDYSLSLSPATATAQTTGSATYSLGISEVNGVSAAITTSISGLPAGATTPGCLGTLPTNTWTAPVTIQTVNVAAGSYPFTITGTVGSVTRTVSGTLVVQAVPAVTGSISPASAMVPAGQSANLTVTLNSQDGAAGMFTLGCANLPSGATCAFSPGSPTLTANGSVTDTLTVQVASSVAAGSYPFTVTATSGSLTTSAAATLVVQAPPSFNGSTSPSSATISVGQSASFAIALSSQNGATGAVSLQCLNVPSGTTCAFNPTSPTLPANGSVSDQLTIQVTSRPAAPVPRSPCWQTPPNGHLPTAWLLGAVALCLAVGIELRRRKVCNSVSMAAALGLVLVFLATASCGGGGGSGSGPNPTPSPVVVTITVQASVADISTPQTVGTLTLTVN